MLQKGGTFYIPPVIYFFGQYRTKLPKHQSGIDESGEAYENRIIAIINNY